MKTSLSTMRPTETKSKQTKLHIVGEKMKKVKEKCCLYSLSSRQNGVKSILSHCWLTHRQVHGGVSSLRAERNSTSTFNPFSHASLFLSLQVARNPFPSLSCRRRPSSTCSFATSHVSTRRRTLLKGGTLVQEEFELDLEFSKPEPVSQDEFRSPTRPDTYCSLPPIRNFRSEPEEFLWENSTFLQERLFHYNWQT